MKNGLSVFRWTGCAPDTPRPASAARRARARPALREKAVASPRMLRPPRRLRNRRECRAAPTSLRPANGWQGSARSGSSRTRGNADDEDRVGRGEPGAGPRREEGGREQRLRAADDDRWSRRRHSRASRGQMRCPAHSARRIVRSGPRPPAPCRARNGGGAGRSPSDLGPLQRRRIAAMSSSPKPNRLEIGEAPPGLPRSGRRRDGLPIGGDAVARRPDRVEQVAVAHPDARLSGSVVQQLLVERERIRDSRRSVPERPPSSSGAFIFRIVLQNPVQNWSASAIRLLL